MKVNKYNLSVVILVAIGTISTAYGLAVIGSTVGQPNFYTYFDLASSPTSPSYAHTTNMIGALNGINSAGAVCGCLLQAWIADRYGRKPTIQLGSLILIVGGVLCSAAVHIGMFLVGRFVAGMGAGVLACIVPIYQAEVSTAETRGAMVCVTGVMYAVGYSLAGWLGYACWHMGAESKAAEFSWRFPLAFQVIFPLAVLVGSAWVPESPRWLLQNGRRAEALGIVERLHSSPVSTASSSTTEDRERGEGKEAARREFYLIEKQVEVDRSLTRQSFELFRGAANRKRALIAFILMWGNQFLGVFVLTNYGVLIYASLGLTGSVPLLLNACWTSFTLIGNTWTAFFVDRYGRRRFLLIGASGCTLSVIFLCALTASFLDTTNVAGLRAAVFFIFFYIFWWCFFVDATQFVYLAEIFPNHLRSQGVAFGLSSFYLSSEVTLVAAPVALDQIQWRFYLVLIVPSLVYIVAIWFLFPETKGRTLEEIGTLFGDEHVASRWYGASEEERKRMAEEALREMQDSETGTGSEGEKGTTVHVEA